MDKMRTKYIFITGGVCSSLGKGIAAASLASLLELRGFKVGLQKIDPYINVDAGTMSPYQHGEVFVTEDGAETDLDLGNYERFTNSPIGRINSITTGQIYLSVINKERRGEYLGKTVQVVPHITGEIKARIKKVAVEYNLDILIVEIGGTVGDIESIPFIEAIRQFALDIEKENVLFIHLTLIPYIPVSGELKTKPTQHSVKELGSLGILPDVLMCRTSRPLTEEIKEKIAIMTNIEKKAVIQALDISTTIYEIPLQYSKEGLDDIVIEKLRLPRKKRDLSMWEKIVNVIKNPDREVTVGVVGKYLGLPDSYKSLFEALTHGGIPNRTKVNIKKIDAECFSEEDLKDVNSILIPGGFGIRGVEGKIKAISYARENNIPLFGICLGMQLMVIEFARNVIGLREANSEEFDEDTPYPVISLMEEQKEIINLGGSMRLGTYKTKIDKSSRLYKIYKTDYIYERHRHRFEFNNQFRKIFEENGVLIAGIHEETGLVEVIEIKDHKWAIGVQFHPEYKSKPFKPSPLFVDFIRVSIK